ncbi:MAG TPA: hypothetical protein VGG39_24915 [Polyangiaceae bacterium]|jgi:hypothetical protein
MRRIAFALLFAVALAGLLAFAAPAALGQGSGYFPGPLLPAGSVNLGAQAVSVGGATPATVLSDPLAPSTAYTYAGQLVCAAPTATGDAGAGSTWSASVSFSAERVSTGAATIVGSSTVSSVRTAGGGAVATGASVTTSGNAVLVQWGASVGTSYSCTVLLQRTEAP